MAKIRKKKTKKSSEVPIEGTQPSDKIKQYFHNYTKRSNNPPVGLVTPETDTDMSTKQYSYDPHLDPQLTWTGKTEHTSFEVDTVSLHVHERIDPMTIIEKVLKIPRSEFIQKTLFEFFNSPENNPPLREAIEFYKHDQSWSNRLVAGDSLLVMNSLLQKEGLGSKVQMIYIDPPYGIQYGSNFQPFVNKKQVKDGKDEDLSQEPETIKAFRDAWELDIHSYLTYLRDRLLLAKELLSDSGSIFVQISDKNVHLVRIIMDEIFGKKNFVSEIVFIKSSGKASGLIDPVYDFLIWYAKDKSKIKYHQLFNKKEFGKEGATQYNWIELEDGTRRRLSSDEFKNPNNIPKNSHLFTISPLTSATPSESTTKPFVYDGKTFLPPTGGWKTNLEGLTNLAKSNRLIIVGNLLRYVRYIDDFPAFPLTNFWNDTAVSGFAEPKIFVVQTNTKVTSRCILMTTDPGDLVLDITCGSGTTALMAEQFGRRWITCDSSRVAITLTRQRLMTSVFPYFQLNRPQEGIGSGFIYNTIPHITLRSIARNEPTQKEVLFDDPEIDKNKIRVCGPFTTEAVPSPVVKSFDFNDSSTSLADVSLSRIGETLRQDQWRNELQKTGIRGKGGQKIEFSRVEVFPGVQWLHVDAETKNDRKRVVVSFGPEYAPLEQRQVARAIEEAQKLVPRPQIIVFAAFQFDPEAAKDIDELNWPGVTILKVQMNADLLTEDLKKERSSNESFWLMGQPDVELKKTKDGKYVVEVNGFDYYNTKTGEIESGDSSRISMWMLDTDYDGRSLYPQQVFFPMSGTNDGWSKLGKILQSEIDEDLLTEYRGTTSLSFIPGTNKQIAIKIIDDRGIESLRILQVE